MFSSDHTSQAFFPLRRLVYANAPQKQAPRSTKLTLVLPVPIVAGRVVLRALANTGLELVWLVVGPVVAHGSHLAPLDLWFLAYERKVGR